MFQLKQNNLISFHSDYERVNPNSDDLILLKLKLFLLKENENSCKEGNNNKENKDNTFTDNIS